MPKHKGKRKKMKIGKKVMTILMVTILMLSSCVMVFADGVGSALLTANVTQGTIDISISTSDVDFGNIPRGTKSGVHTVTVTSGSGTTVSITITATLTGDAAGITFYTANLFFNGEAATKTIIGWNSDTHILPLAGNSLAVDLVLKVPASYSTLGLLPATTLVFTATPT